MARYARIEGVFRQRIGAGQQPKPGARHDEVQESRHRTNRAVAVVNHQAGWCVDFEADCAAMAAAAVGDEVSDRSVHAATLTPPPTARSSELVAADLFREPERDRTEQHQGRNFHRNLLSPEGWLCLPQSMFVTVQGNRDADTGVFRKLFRWD
jgi:hypothetical protein